MRKYILLLITAITFGQASDQMVTFTQAQSLGFSLKSGQSHITSNQCMTKIEALAKYNLDASAMNSYASNQLVPRSAWVNGAFYIGQPYQGGKIAYLDGTGIHGFIVTNSYGTNVKWNSTNSGTTGANGIVIGTGQANTNSIIALYGIEFNAAKYCDDLVTGGYSDWYLPSNNELLKIIDNYVALGGTSFLPNNNNFWSSTETPGEPDRARAFKLDGTTGPGSMNWLKETQFYATAIRSF